MIKIYKSHMDTNEFIELNDFESGSWINMVNPTQEEIDLVCEKVKIEQGFIKYSLDYEEKARIDAEDKDNTVLFLIDVPIIEKEGDSEVYTTMPLGMIVVRDEFFITVSLKPNSIIQNFENMKIKNFSTYKKSRFILQILYTNATQYLIYLKQISKETENAETRLKDAQRNKELLKMLSLDKSLVYFRTSLKSNELVMEKTMRGKILKLYDEDEDILEDAIIENRQAIEMSKIYSDILNGTMDAYASIISNNLNGVMKFLTSITIILAIPTLIASLWGMNVPVPFQGSAFGFIAMTVFAILAGVVAIIWLKKKDMFN